MPEPDERSTPETEETARLPVHPTDEDPNLDEDAATVESLGRWQRSASGGDGVRLPARYDIRDGDSGRYLRSIEAPGLGVAVDPSYAFTEAEARKLGTHTILLDGAGQFGPLIDSTRQLYNLDHHAGCSRAFTLATCEQALILVVKGLELDQGDWRILANEPDLDTVFAIWVLLNYRRLRSMTEETRDEVAALIRLEGAIDANGFEVAQFCGLPHDLIASTRTRLDALHAKELTAKKQGAWADGDLLAYVRDRLIDIDHMVFRPEDFADLARVGEELGHVDIGGGRVAVAVRDDAGIYDVEGRLKKVWGERLGLVLLAKGGNHYTIRRVAALADIDLQAAYDRFNQLDPAVDGHPPKKRWGGSDEIGGSPRPEGTDLEPTGVLRVVGLAYQPSSVRDRINRIGRATLLGALGIGLLYVLGWLAEHVWPEAAVAASPRAFAGVGLCAAMIAAVITLIRARGRTWQHGWRWPAGEDWLFAVPAVLVGALLGGVWIPSGFEWNPLGLGLAVAAAIAIQSGLTLWIFGVAHGELVSSDPIQLLKGRWFLSLPALTACVVYAVAVVVLAWLWHLPMAHLVAPAGAAVQLGASIGGAVMVGLACAVIRERSLSLLTVIAALTLGAIARVVVGHFL